MSLTLLDLYNSCATQEWSMYDNDAMTNEEMEQSLVLALNKSIIEILYSYPFSFRLKTHIIFTKKGIVEYNLPKGLIQKDNSNNFSVFFNNKNLKCLENHNDIEISKQGYPEYFYILEDKIHFYPIPADKFIISIKYETLVIGENKSGENIYSLKNIDDVVKIPEFLEEIFKNTVIAKTMLNSIASESDENFSAYKKQYEQFYKLLMKYSKGVEPIKHIII